MQRSCLFEFTHICDKQPCLPEHMVQRDCSSRPCPLLKRHGKRPAMHSLSRCTLNALMHSFYFNVRTIVLRASGPCFNLSRHYSLVYRPPKACRSRKQVPLVTSSQSNVQNHVLYITNTNQQKSFDRVNVHFSHKCIELSLTLNRRLACHFKSNSEAAGNVNSP